MKNRIHFLLLAFLLSGCAVGPLVNHETARTLGKANNEVVAGYGSAGYVLKWNFGLAEKWDIGLHWESLSIGLRAKHSFLLNNETGWSLAVALGTGSSIGGSHYYGDLMASHLSGAWEPYATFRAVKVKTDPLEFKDEDTGETDFKIDSENFSYGQFMAGTRYWFSPKWLLSLEASTLFAISDSVKIDSGLLISAAFGLKF